MTRNVKLGLIVAVAVIFAVAIALFLFTFTVRFTEVAVATRFGEAIEVYDGETEAGLHIKLPYPIDSITTYDTRARLVQLRKEAQQTADNRQLIVEAFCTWSVSDPIRFFERFSSEGDRANSHYEAAREAIRSRLRTAVGEISRYRFDELFEVQDTPGEHPRLAELEHEILLALNAPNTAGQTIEQRTGIAIGLVGISSIVLPRETSSAVFERMKQDRRTLVEEITSQAESEAQAIISAAETDRDRIEAFALERAQEYRAMGDREAAVHLAKMGEHEELAVFLEQVEFIRNLLARKATLVLSTEDTFFRLFDLDVIAKTPPGEVPGVEGFPGLDQTTTTTAAQRPDETEETIEEEPAEDPDQIERASMSAGGGK